MCFLALLLIMLGPRVAVMVCWLFRPHLILAPFEYAALWPILGALLLPGTTLAYVMVWSPSSGPFGADLVWLGLGLAFDIVLYVAFYYNSILVEAVSAQWLRRKQP